MRNCYYLILFIFNGLSCQSNVIVDKRPKWCRKMESEKFTQFLLICENKRTQNICQKSCMNLFSTGQPVTEQRVTVNQSKSSFFFQREQQKQFLSAAQSGNIDELRRLYYI